LSTPHDLPAPSELERPVADVSGRWAVRVRYLYGHSDYTVSLAQDGNALTGELSTPYAVSPVDGTISGSEVAWEAILGYEANRTPYRFSGTLTDGAMGGKVTLGEFGRADWEAHRIPGTREQG